MTTHGAVRELAGLFLRLGVTAFGGPAAHIAMMRHEVVERHRWLTDADFLDLLAATHLIPGPNSTEMAIHLGLRRAGAPGLLVAGACFILPAALVVGGLAWTYVRFGDTPQLDRVMYGVGPVIIAVVAQALWKLGAVAIKGPLTLFVGLAAAGLALRGANELALLAAGGLVMAAARPGRPGIAAVAGALLSAVRRIRRSGSSSTGIAAAAGALLSGTAALAAGAGPAAVPVTLTRLTVFFLKVGSVLFGSGYVLLAFLRGDLVDGWGWLSDAQLIDAVTIGQVTPGPVFTTATFIGYVLHGWSGALLATVGIFAPGFVFVACSQPLVPRLRASAVTGAVLDGVVVASLGLMAAVTWNLFRSTIADPGAAVLALAAAVLLFRTRLNSTWLVLAGGVVGTVLRGAG